MRDSQRASEVAVIPQRHSLPAIAIAVLQQGKATTQLRERKGAATEARVEKVRHGRSAYQGTGQVINQLLLQANDWNLC